MGQDNFLNITKIIKFYRLLQSIYYPGKFRNFIQMCFS